MTPLLNVWTLSGFVRPWCRVEPLTPYWYEDAVHPSQAIQEPLEALCR
jgi:hypothetical protein